MTASSVLSTISQEFESLAEFVLMEGRESGKASALTLHEVKSLLLARSTSGSTRDLIWRDIFNSVRSENGSWPTIALGLALPGLNNLAKR